MRVLVVEDDRSLGLFLQKGLMLQGHDVEWAGDGETAVELAEAQTPDLMVLDLGLPVRDGMEVLAVMQSRFESTAVLVLTGRCDVEDRVRCLNLGADDFLQKPFSFHELIARCAALLRRREKFAEHVLQFGGVAMNRIERTVKFGGVPLDLTGKEYRLLEFMMQRRGKCCTRVELLSEVWQTTPGAGANIVDVYVTYLRKKMVAAQPQGESAIETVRGQGYRVRDRRKAPRLSEERVDTSLLQPQATALRA